MAKSGPKGAACASAKRKANTVGKAGRFAKKTTAHKQAISRAMRGKAKTKAHRQAIARAMRKSPCV